MSAKSETKKPELQEILEITAVITLEEIVANGCIDERDASIFLSTSNLNYLEFSYSDKRYKLPFKVVFDTAEEVV